MRLLYTGTRKTLWTPPPGVWLEWEPLLEIAHLPLPPWLAQTIAQEAAGLVFYSAHAVDAARALLHLLPKATPFWVVGRKCAQPLRTMGFAHVLEPPESGQNFEGLVGAMRQHPELPSTLVVLGLDEAPRPLGQALGDRDVVVQDIPAYKSVVRTSFPVAHIHKTPPDWVLLTSPRGAQAWAAMCGELPLQVGSIGPTTSKACEQLGLEVRHQASVPDVGVLCEEIVRGQDNMGC